MSDQEFIERIAALWIELDGDSDGVTYCWPRLRDEVERQAAQREEG